MIVTATLAAVLSELDDVFRLREEPGTAPKALLGGKDVFTSLGFHSESPARCGSPQGGDTSLVSPLAPSGSSEMWLPGSAGPFYM